VRAHSNCRARDFHRCMHARHACPAHICCERCDSCVRRSSRAVQQISLPRASQSLWTLHATARRRHIDGYGSCFPWARCYRGQQP
jgi:hypothetical protein